MTRRFNIEYTCQWCGKQTTAETGFGRWMRNNPKLDSAAGTVRTDTDHTVLRYKTHEQGREYQLIMDIEVKEFGAEPNNSQRDILAFKHQLAMQRGENMHGARTTVTRHLRSPLLGRKTRVRYCGSHLLQFERTNPDDSRWIRWNRKEISATILEELLLFERDPYCPERSMVELLRDRHAQPLSFL